MAAGGSASAGSIRRSANLPTPISFTICGWANVIAKGSGTFTNLCSLESGLTSAANSVQMSWANSGSELFVMSAYPTQYNFARYPFPGTSGFSPIYFALTGQGTGSTDLRGYWMYAGGDDMQMVVGAGKSFTSGALFLGNGSYNDWSNSRFANVKVYGKALQPHEILAEWRSPVPIRYDNLNSWSPLESTTDLVDYHAGRNWSTSGTVASGASPAFYALNTLPSPIQRLGGVYLADDGGVTVYDSRSAIIPFALRGPGKPMPILGPDGRPATWISPPGGDVTVAITGAAATFSAGTLTPSTTVPVSGAAITSAAGTVVPSTTVPVTGAAGTFAAGTVTPSTTVAATGAAGTFAAGTVSPSTTVPVTGAAAAFAPGTVTPSTAVPVAGAAATFTAGALGGLTVLLPDTRTAAVPFNLRGPGKPQPIFGPTREPLTWTESAPSNSVTVAISGAAAAFSAGTLTPSTTVPVTGAAGTFSPGTVAPGAAVAPSGAAATFAPGSVVPSLAVPLVGASATATAGTVVPSTTVAVAGAAATFAAGTVTPSTGTDVTVAITGARATFTAGTVTTSGGDTSTTPIRRNVTTVLAWLDTRLAAVASASSTTGALRTGGHRFTLEREPLTQMDGDTFVDIEALTPGMRNRAAGEAYWEATVVVRVAYQRDGGDAAGGDRQSVMRDGAADAMRIADVCELVTAYDSANTGVSRVTYMGATRAATFKRGEIWETRLLVRWRSDSYTG